MNYLKSHLMISLLLTCLALTACGGSESDSHEPSTQDPSLSVNVYKPTGAVQCSQTPSTSDQMAKMVSTLSDSGVTVLASSCGIDGLAHVALCGAVTGEIWIVTVAPASEQTALSLGFRPLAEVPQAFAVNCAP